MLPCCNCNDLITSKILLNRKFRFIAMIENWFGNSFIQELLRKSGDIMIRYVGWSHHRLCHCSLNSHIEFYESGAG